MGKGKERGREGTLAREDGKGGREGNRFIAPLTYALIDSCMWPDQRLNPKHWEYGRPL